MTYIYILKQHTHTDTHTNKKNTVHITTPFDAAKSQKARLCQACGIFFLDRFCSP